MKQLGIRPHDTDPDFGPTKRGRAREAMREQRGDKHDEDLPPEPVFCRACGTAPCMEAGL